ncbi:MAG: MinD/ParA family protein [Eubacteriales bacterium]|nr:MinD/ParA family protein [Eubacteriales bacterium]
MDQAERLRNIIKQQNKKKHLARVITVTSGKGGVGKSNVSVNLAIQLSRMGKKVVILDADFGLANIEVMLGLRPKYNLADMMFRGKNVRDILTPGPENIGFISGGSGLREMTNLDKDQIQSLVTSMYELDQVADIILIDTGAGISDAVIDLVMCSAEVLLVTTPEPTSITDAYALLKTIRRQDTFDPGKMKIRMIGNRVQSYEEGKELYYKMSTVSGKFLQMDMEYMGAIPEDAKLQSAVRKQQPISIAAPNAPAARALMELAMVLENGLNEEQTQQFRGISGLLARMFRGSRQ